ncbi:MAG: HAMP domain-containing histidine kinase [Lachnospiraceae bacterium]|nr:HAMP domain-containing histidine kinase [Lachnospiraceae bacterium]
MAKLWKICKRVGIFLVVLFATLGFCFAVVDFFDIYLNHVVCDVIFWLFMSSHTIYENGREIVSYEPDWGSLKLFISIAFFLLMFLLVFGGWLVAGIAGNIQKRKLGRELEKIKAENQHRELLLQAEAQQKNDLITYLAHDLKTPLASVIGYLSLLDETPDIPREQREKYTRVSLDKAFRLEQLIYEFFDITRFNLQQIVLNRGNVHIRLLLEQLAEEFYPMVEPDGKRILVEAPEELLYWGDGDKLARVFNNILKNAVAYSYPHTEICLKAYQEDKHLVVSCTNQGDPIPEQKLQTIFEKFYRLDTARSTKTGGSGLGLAIAREIVKAHRGTIQVASDREHTVFTVMLPLED